MRIVHLSDIHIWRYAYNPARLFSKRSLVILELLSGRAKKFRLERLVAVVEQEPRHHRPPNRRSRSALATTLTLENAIAADAITGLSRPIAASGSAATL